MKHENIDYVLWVILYNIDTQEGKNLLWLTVGFNYFYSHLLRYQTIKLILLLYRSEQNN